jgi:recombinational DNA repair ATPase RecF
LRTSRVSKKLDFSPDQTISILIGRNNVGNSNILDALWAIGKALEERREIFKN